MLPKHTAAQRNCRFFSKFLRCPRQLDTSAKLSYKNSVILSEARGGLAFSFAVRRAESKDLCGTRGARGTKVKLPSKGGGEPAIGHGALSALAHLCAKSGRVLDSANAAHSPRSS